jgi:pantoate--beta-alanine ligase
MQIIKTINQMQKAAHKLKRSNKTIGLVPTMGALHEGHISLARKARGETDCVVVSIFVNPAQFGPNEDYLCYPRPFNRDRKLCLKENVDIIFAPSVKEMYQENHLTYVKVEKMSNILCGRYRPIHFRGVTTIVAKLFNIVLPDRAYFGEKDFQQLKILQKMVRDLNFPVRISPCKIIREPDGLAKSSRNVYLDRLERENADKIYRTLTSVKKLISKNEITTINSATAYLKKNISKIPNSKIEYIKFCHPETLEEIKKDKIHLPLHLLTAVRVGKARLIDNIKI